MILQNRQDTLNINITVNINSISKKSLIGYILEVDLKYPDELHVLHNDYPLVPEKLSIPYDMLSYYRKKIAGEYQTKFGDAIKLNLNLGNKTNYLLHYKNLLLYLSLGMNVTKIYIVLKFKQFDWMKKYIDFNTEERRNAANSFETDFLKLMINSIYGKTMENLRKRINVELVNNKIDFLKYTSKPTYITREIFDKNYAAIHERKPVLTLNKPVYVGFTALELSKGLMFYFYYNFIKKHFDSELLFTNTDSLAYHIKSEDVYEELFKDKHLFDLNNYSKDSKVFYPVNEKVIGKIKDVYEGKINDEFVGLKSKMYSMKDIDGKESNMAKGINIATVFNEFKDILFN